MNKLESSRCKASVDDA